MCGTAGRIASRHSSAPLLEPGRLHTSASPTAPHTPRPSMPKVRPSASLARRIASARPGLAVDHHAGAFGREVARTEPGATGGDHEALEAGGEIPQRERDFVDAVGRDLVVDDRESRVDQPLDHLGARAVDARATAHAVGDDEHLGREREAHGVVTAAAAAARMARPAATGSSALNTALPDTRMSTPAAAAAGAVSTLIPPSISISTARPRASISLRATCHLVEHVGDERLAAPAGVHAHDEQQVDLVEVRQHGVDGRLGIEHEAHADVAPAQLVEQGPRDRRARCARCSGRRRRSAKSASSTPGLSTMR